MTTLALWALVGTAAAHPLEGAWWGLGLGLDVQEDRLVVDYRVEIPAADVLRELHQARATGTADTFGARKLTALRDGLRITVDGAPASCADVTVPQAGDDPRFVPYQLRRVCPLSRAPHAILVEDHNGPDAAAAYLATARIAPGWSLAATSLVDVDGPVVDLDGAWRREPAARRTTLTLRPAGPFARWLRPRATGAARAVDLPLPTALAAPSPRALPVALAALLAAGAGLAAGGAPRADLAGIGVLAGVLVAGDLPPVAVAVAGVTAAAIAATRALPWAVGLTIGSAAAAFGDPRAALPIAAVGLAGLLLRRRVAGVWAERAGVAAVLALGLGVVWRVA